MQVGVTTAKLSLLLKDTKYSHKTHFILRFIMLYTEKFGLQDCFCFLQIESHIYVHIVTVHWSDYLCDCLSKNWPSSHLPVF